MKLFKQLGIIFSILFIGEAASKIFNLIIPGNVIGMMLLLAALFFNIIKLEQVEGIANFFLDHLAFFFLPGTVSLMAYSGVIKTSGIQIIVICVFSTAVVMGVTGLVTQFLIKNTRRKKDAVK